MENLNLYVLEEELTNVGFDIVARRLSSDPWELDASHPLLYVAGMDFFEGPVYVAAAADLPEEPPSALALNLVVVGGPPATYLRPPHNVLVLDGSLSPFDLLSQIMALFQRYGAWQKKLDAIVSSRRPLRDLGVASLEIMGNPINLWTPAYRSIFYCVGDLVEEGGAPACDLEKLRLTFAYMRDDAYLPMENLQIFVSDENFASISKTDHPVLYENNEFDFGCRSLIVALGAPKNLMGYLIVDEVNHEMAGRDMAAMMILGTYVKRLLAFQQADTAEESAFEDVLVSLLARVPVEGTWVKDVARRFGWDDDDVFELWAARGASSSLPSASVRALRTIIRQGGEAVCSVQFNGDLVVLLNVTREKEQDAKSGRRILESIAERVEAVGASYPFSGLSLVPVAYEQAVLALSLSEGKDSGAPLFYAGCANEALMMRCRGDWPAQMLTPPPLRQLIDYDEDHGFELVKMLDRYLDNNLNVSQTARDCFMHRNSCTAKLALIEEVMGCDLADPEIAFLLRVALRVLRSFRRSPQQ